MLGDSDRLDFQKIRRDFVRLAITTLDFCRAAKGDQHHTRCVSKRARAPLCQIFLDTLQPRVVHIRQRVLDDPCLFPEGHPESLGIENAV